MDMRIIEKVNRDNIYIYIYNFFFLSGSVLKIYVWHCALSKELHFALIKLIFFFLYIYSTNVHIYKKTVVCEIIQVYNQISKI
jgi:hypothetical protein